jgi:hypothetical protein
MSVAMSSMYTRIEVFTEVAMMKVVFWDVTPCGSSNNRRFGVTYHLHERALNNQRPRKNVSNN